MDPLRTSIRDKSFFFGRTSTGLKKTLPTKVLPASFNWVSRTSAGKMNAKNDLKLDYE